MEGFINLGSNLNDVVEQNPVNTGIYDVVIVEAKEVSKDKEDGTTQKSIKVQLEIEGNDSASNFFHDIFLPKEGATKKAANFQLQLIKKFLLTFKIPFEGGTFNVMDFAGARAKVPVQLTTYKTKEGIEKPINKLNI